MRTLTDILYPLRERPRADGQTADSMRELEYPARLMPDATAWTLKHLGLLVLASAAGMVAFLVAHAMGHYELVSLSAALLFAYGLGSIAALVPLLIPLAAALVAADTGLGACLLPPACLLSFSQSFARHYVYLQTASPVSPTIARETRKRICLLRYYLAVLALVFFAWVLTEVGPAERRELYHNLSAAWYRLAPQLALLYLLFPPYDKLRAGCRALREWFQYNSQHLDEPGVFISPCGSASRRLIPIYLLAFLLAAPWALALAGPFAIEPTDQTILLASLLFADWWQWLLPVLTLLSSTFLLTAPILCHARRIAKAARGSDFASNLERLDLMDAGAR